jgi:hypothetical protein
LAHRDSGQAGANGNKKAQTNICAFILWQSERWSVVLHFRVMMLLDHDRRS